MRRVKIIFEKNEFGEFHDLRRYTLKMRSQICIWPHPFVSFGLQSFANARTYPIDRFKEGRMHDIHFRICLIKETFATEWVG